MITFKSLLCVLIIKVSTTAAESSSATFTLFDNGASQGGVDVSLSLAEFPQSSEDSGERFAIEMSKYITVSKYKATEVVATKAFREDGEKIVSFEQLLPNDKGETRRVYLVAEDLEFVWPFISLGYNQTVSPKVLEPIEEGGEPVIIESLSETPRVFRVFNFFSLDEGKSLIDNALNLTGVNALKRSTVGNAKTGDGDAAVQGHQDPTRTSDNAWDHSSVPAKAMIKRSFQLTNVVEDSGKVDGLQIVRYHQGQGYNTHPDYFTAKDDEDFNFNPYEGGSNRFATVFMYLTEPDEGGFTVFPRAPGIIEARKPPAHALSLFSAKSWQYKLTKECYKQLAVPAKAGTVALFYSVKPNGQLDPSSHHGACPVISGTKWGVNIWIWNKQRYGAIKTGDARKLTLTNTLDETVYITWEGKENGTIRPHGSIHIDTYEFHRFQAHLGSHKQKEFASFTVQSEPNRQIWHIDPPKTTRLSHSGTDEL